MPRAAMRTTLFSVSSEDVPMPDETVHCRRCGYDLRGLSADGRCPECGTPVRLALGSELLAFCDPQWIARVRTGAVAVLSGLAGIVALTFAFLVLRFHGFLGALLAFAFPSLVAIGTWMMTEADPGEAGGRQTAVERWTARLALAAALAWQAVVLVLSSSDAGSIISAAGRALDVPLSLLRAAGEWAMYMYAGRLAMRVPDPLLARRARSLAWASGVSLAVWGLGSSVASLIIGWRISRVMPRGLLSVQRFLVRSGRLGSTATLLCRMSGAAFMFQLVQTLSYTIPVASRHFASAQAPTAPKEPL